MSGGLAVRLREHDGDLRVLRVELQSWSRTGGVSRLRHALHLGPDTPTLRRAFPGRVDVLRRLFMRLAHR